MSATPGPVPGSILPDYRGRCIAGLPSLILQALGLADADVLPMQDVLPPDMTKGIRRVALVVADGLGFRLLRRMMADHPDMGFHALEQRGLLTSLTSVLPSTTTAALTSISTGLTPQQHGMLGYRLFLREVGMVANMIAFSPHTSHTEFPASQISPNQFLTRPTLFQTLRKNNLGSHVIMPRPYQNSALSRMLYRGAETRPYVAAHDAFVLFRQSLESTNASLRLVHFYWDEIDIILHHYGPSSPVVDACVENLAHNLVEHSLKNLKADGTLLLLTADHGHVETRASQSINLRLHPDLMHMLIAPPCGDARLPYLHARPECVEAVGVYLQTHFGHCASIMPSHEALEAGWFGVGDVHPETPSRLGQFVVVPHAAWKFIYPATAEERDSIGRHGGMDPEEMEVPLLALRL